MLIPNGLVPGQRSKTRLGNTGKMKTPPKVEALDVLLYESKYTAIFRKVKKNAQADSGSV